MKKTLIAVLLAFATISARAEHTAQEAAVMGKFLSGETTAVVMAGMDNLMLELLEEIFRETLKPWEEQVNARSTYEQQAYIKIIVKDMYYSEIRPTLREKYQALSPEELYLIASAVKSGDENHKGSALSFEIATSEEVKGIIADAIDTKVKQFSFGCDFINKSPSQYTEQQNSTKGYRKLIKGDAYIVSSPVPVWIAYGSNKHASFHEIPTGGAFKIATLRATASSTWYGVFVIDLFGDKLGNGWINSEDLQGQQLIPYSK